MIEARREGGDGWTGDGQLGRAVWVDGWVHEVERQIGWMDGCMDLDRREDGETLGGREWGGHNQNIFMKANLFSTKTE